MDNWYYVNGSERVGPVDFLTLQKLYLDNVLNQESYVWKKGFTNWERIKDVVELDFSEIVSEDLIFETEVEDQKIENTIVEATDSEARKIILEHDDSPIIDYTFDWHTFKGKDHEELFFIKVGKDRKNFEGTEIFGPYSIVELKMAIENKRINMQTLIYTAGMSSWCRIQDTNLSEKYQFGISSNIVLNEMPLLLVFSSSPLPIITMVKKAGVKESILLGAGPFDLMIGEVQKTSLYVGTDLKNRNVEIKILKYNKKDQTILCSFVDISNDVKKIILNHAV
jgi:hypothetical protein